MRFEGKLATWNGDRGFGFIAPTQGGQEVFVHVSAFPRDGHPPRLNELLTFQVELNKDGKKRAIRVGRPGTTGHRAAPYAPPTFSDRLADARHPRRKRGWGVQGVVLMILLMLGAYGYEHYQKQVQARALVVPESKPSNDPLASSTAYRCDGRTMCSQMTSCAEATYFLKNCPNTQMDGNHDGVPCEQQWCR